MNQIDINTFAISKLKDATKIPNPGLPKQILRMKLSLRLPVRTILKETQLKKLLLMIADVNFNSV